MPTTVAMYDKARAHIGDRLDALGLDLAIYTFDGDGNLFINGTNVLPKSTDIDYIWLNIDLANDGVTEAAFQLVLDCRSVGLVQTFNAGLDSPIYRRIAERGIRICNSSAQAVAISEYVLAHALSLIHPIDVQREAQANREWQRTPFREVSSTNWMIVGYGPIGQEVAKRAKAFGANVTVIRRSPATSDIVDRSGTLADMAGYLAQTDVVVLACPLNAETRSMVDAAFFAQLKPGAILISIARGALIDDDALLAAVDDDRLTAAVLDVFHEEPLLGSNPLWGHPKVRVTAHTSFAGDGTRRRWDQLFLDNIIRFVNGATLINEVDPNDVP